jgi:hypothetical protein
MIRFLGTGMSHWSNAAKPARFIGMNGFTSILVVGMLFYKNLEFFLFSIVVMALLLWIERVKKMTIRSFLRGLKVWFVGRLRSTQDIMRDWFNG